MSDMSYIIDCLIEAKDDETNLLFHAGKGDVLVKLDGYAIVPMDNYKELQKAHEDLKAQLAKRDELLAKSRLLIENCQNECDWNIYQSGYVAIVEHLKLMDAVDPIEIQEEEA